MHICLILPAAGRSRRFTSAAGADGTGGDKLAQDLGGRPLLVRTIEAFAKRAEVKHIIVAGPPDDFEAFRGRFGPVLGFHGATLVEGGRVERWETVRNALAAVPAGTTHVAVHDAARPGVSDELVTRVFEAARMVAAVIPGLPIHGTVKRVSEAAESIASAEDAVADLILGDAGRAAASARRVRETLDRRGLMEIQTPQVFELSLLRRAYAQPDLNGATDDASLIEWLGEPVHVVEGDPRNFKVTTQADLRLMRAVLGLGEPAQLPAHLRF
jgi:2-C-methyl-D-erythritol 4-phosphate cytidylyltransferase